MTNSIKELLLFSLAISDGNLETARKIMAESPDHPSSFPFYMKVKSIASNEDIAIAWDLTEEV